ncbi:TPA: hypothetical protein ACH3X1_001302 [Trebouxia sp. C0004]
MPTLCDGSDGGRSGQLYPETIETIRGHGIRGVQGSNSPQRPHTRLSAAADLAVAAPRRMYEDAVRAFWSHGSTTSEQLSALKGRWRARVRAQPDALKRWQGWQVIKY